MSSNSDTFDFVDTIKQQKIFANVFSIASSGTTRNKLALRHNKDLFVAASSNIRCCTVNSKSANYYLLVGSHKFVIKSIKLNNSGTFLAALGAQQVEVFVLPTNINSSDSNIVSTKVCSLRGFSGNVVKAVWQTAVASDSCLVVLNDQNVIYVYNILLSESPVSVVDLKRYDGFKEEEAASITFGSDLYLAGSLTLYIATKSSKMFGIFPFVRPDERIVATKEQVLNGCSETLDLMQLLNMEFPSLQEDSYNKKLYEQLRFYVYLKKQLEDRTNLVEPRFNNHGEPVNSYKLHHLLSGSEMTLQGPLAALNGQSVSDISSICSNSEISVLAAASSNAKALSITYLAQLKPLVMNNDLSRIPQHEAQPQMQPAQRDHNYSRPAVGFGYLDDSSDEEVEQELPVALVAPETAKARYWVENLISITALGTDEIPNAVTGASASIEAETFGQRLLVHLPGSTLVVNTSSWLSQLVLGVATDSSDIVNDYRKVSAGRSTFFTLMKDDITFTGVYGLQFNCDDDTEKALRIVQIEEAEKPTAITSLAKTKPIVAKSTTVVPDTLIEELIQRIRLLDANKPHAIQFTNSASQLDKIEIVNEFSVESIETIGGFTEVLVKLAMKVSTSLVTLRKQVELMSSLHNTDIEVESRERLEVLREKQAKLSVRLKTLHDKLIEKLEQLKVERKTPLSLAEKQWFKEVNEVTETVNKRMVSQLYELRSQVKHIQAALKDKNFSAEEPVIHNNDISRIRCMLETQGKSIGQIKNRIETLAKQIH